MSDFVKIITGVVDVGLDALNMVQDNVEQALPDRSAISEGELVEDATVSPGASVNHRLGRQALGAFVIKQDDPANPVLVTGLSATAVTVNGSFDPDTTISLWVF